MRRAVCPGSFDPVTNGHLDIVTRSAQLFDEVIVAVLVNEAKSGLFAVEERIDLLLDAIARAELANVTVASFTGLLADFCRANGATAIVKGLRASGDFDYELPMAQMNRRLSGIETLFVPTSPEGAFVASSLVKEVARFGGDVSGLVPSGVLAALHERLSG